MFVVQFFFEKPYVRIYSSGFREAFARDAVVLSHMDRGSLKACILGRNRGAI